MGGEMRTAMNRRSFPEPVLWILVNVTAVLIFIGGCVTPHTKKHEYIVTVLTQTNNWSSQTRQLAVTAMKFGASEANMVATNTMAGNTNMTVIILNVIKLDD